MTYRILADENVEQGTVNYLRKLGHDVERLDDVPELGLGTDDESIARYAHEHDRLILTQDDDFFTELDIENTAGILFQTDQTLSTRNVGDIVHELRSTSASPISPSNTSVTTGYNDRRVSGDIPEDGS